jgi:acetyl/propionyl-CoA carboxylase alpha subunit
MKYLTIVKEQPFRIEIIDEKHLDFDGVVCDVDFNSTSSESVYSLLLNGRSHEAYVYPNEDGWQVLIHGLLYPVVVVDENEKSLRVAAGGTLTERGEFHLKAPMPGLVVAVAVQEGQSVVKGDLLVILESMKMQNELKSPRTGRVETLRVKVGDSVEQKQTLLSVG